MLQFYVVDNLWQGALNTSHFHCLPDAIRAYKALSPSNRKALGIQRGADAIDLVQCLPLFPNDREGEDVMVLRFLEFPLWKSDPQIMEMAQELASRLHPRYCLYRRCVIPAPERDKLPRALRGRYLWPDEPGDFYTAAQWVYVAGVARLHPRYCLYRRCVIPAPERDKLPRALRGRYLWPDEPGDFYTAAQWVYVAGVGRLSSIEFRRRYMDVSSAHYPLVVHISACGMDSRGNYKSLQVSPWDFHLLILRTSSRAAHRALPG